MILDKDYATSIYWTMYKIYMLTAYIMDDFGYLVPINRQTLYTNEGAR